MHFVKSAKKLSAEAGYGDGGVVEYAAAFGVLSAAVEAFLMFAEDCNDLNLMKVYVKNFAERVSE